MTSSNSASVPSGSETSWSASADISNLTAWSESDRRLLEFTPEREYLNEEL